MARKSSIEKNKNRSKLVALHALKRQRLKALVSDKDLPIEERFNAGLKPVSYTHLTLPTNREV